MLPREFGQQFIPGGIVRVFRRRTPIAGSSPLEQLRPTSRHVSRQPQRLGADGRPGNEVPEGEGRMVLKPSPPRARHVSIRHIGYEQAGVVEIERVFAEDCLHCTLVDIRFAGRTGRG